ncbi:MAG: hypothetical protein U9N59_07260 [Campylobacterota bacterium]|nr:hypothetical protein [Campylobacterota bacterium]
MLSIKSVGLSLIVAGVLFSGCIASNSNNITTNETTGKKFVVDNNLPNWVDNVQVGIENGVAAVGQTSYSKYGNDVMLPEAMLKAKAELAATIQEKVYDFQRNAAEKANIDNIESYGKVFKSASKKIVDGVSLSGASRISRYQSPADGTLYVRVMISFEKLKKEIKREVKSNADVYKKMATTQQQANKLVNGVVEESESHWKN